MEYEHIVHSFEPVYDKASEILILGTLPSVKSRENNFYYGHKQNRFWKVLATLLKEPVPDTIEEKKAMLLAHRIALWDVIQSCDIKGSSDSSIKNVVPCELEKVLSSSPIRQIYANGGKAWQLYHRYCEKETGREAVKTETRQDSFIKDTSFRSREGKQRCFHPQVRQMPRGRWNGCVRRGM